MRSLKERLAGRVDTAYRTLLSGEYAGLCDVLYLSVVDFTITPDEYALVSEAVGAHRGRRLGCYMVDRLISLHPDAYPCTGCYSDSYFIRQQPGHVVQQCADKWKVWALGIIDAVDKELGYAE